MIHFKRGFSAITYCGGEPMKVRELLTTPVSTVNKGDILITDDKTAKFLSRPGKEFETIDLNENDLEDNHKLEQVTDDAVAKIDSLTKENLELENQLKILEDEKADFEMRMAVEIQDLQKENQELNLKMETIQSETIKPKTRARKTTTNNESKS
jgi:hypothetical protein